MTIPGSLVEVPAGTLVWLAGDPGEFAVRAHEGELEVIESSPEGDVFVLHVLEPGELAGEAACLDGGGHSATLRARTICRFQRIPAATLRAAVAGDPTFLRDLLRVQVARVRRLSRQVAILGFEPVVRRVARALLEHARVTGKADWGVTHQDLAERVAATRESVTKAVGWLVRQELVTARRGRLEIRSPHRLEALVDGEP